MLHQLKNIDEAAALQNTYGSGIALRTSYSALISHLIPDRISLLKKFFSRTEERKHLAKVLAINYAQYSKPEQELIEKFGAVAFDKQMDIAEAIGENGWSLDMQNGKINFGEQVEFSFKILGSFSRTSNLWNWAWANEEAEKDDVSLNHAYEMKSFGEKQNVDFLKLGSFEAKNIDLHLIGLTASGLLKTTGYYIADYGAGAMVFTVQNNEIPKNTEKESERIITVFNQLISDFDVNQKLALKHYLAEKDYEIVEGRNKLTGIKGTNIIFAEFDNEHTLTKLNG